MLLGNTLLNIMVVLTFLFLRQVSMSHRRWIYIFFEYLMETDKILGKIIRIPSGNYLKAPENYLLQTWKPITKTLSGQMLILITSNFTCAQVLSIWHDHYIAFIFIYSLYFSKQHCYLLQTESFKIFTTCITVPRSKVLVSHWFAG